jgi:hypothetical protein
VRVLDPAVVIRRRLVGGDAAQVQDVTPPLFVLLVVRAGDREVRELVEAAQIPRVGVQDRLVGDFLREQLFFELPEQRRLVVAQLRLDVVLRIQENFARGFPDAVVLPPVPLVEGNALRKHVNGIGGAGRRFLEVHQTAVHVELHRVDRRRDARGPGAAFELDVEQEVVVQVRHFVEGRGGGVHEIRDQSVAAP